ncbi:unnamed protein product [Macrosiphum euphorbiae]|uniref:Uncharacterized protein n=1 Tax=Macrosiphum euphorbiae TaxID=13131 RepID=A0AAV0Y9L2_9HEMI|nr:unnamed protein product [Macrosiphum euphorbiae]
MNHNEDVNDYCHRVEKLYYQLCTVSTLNKEPAEAKIIHETLRDQTLAVFIKGLVEPIRTIVKSRNAKTLEIAKQIVMSEQVELRLEQENRNHYSSSYSQNNNQRRSNYENRNNRNIRPNNFVRAE